MNNKSIFAANKMKYPHHYVADLWRKIPRHLKVTFLSALLIGLAIHLFMLTNKLPNHDDLTQLFDSMYRETSGRWFLFFPVAFGSSFCLPGVKGVLAILYISSSACLVAQCLQIKQTFHCILLSGLMVSMPVVASTMSYMSSVDAYFFALLLSCAAAYVAGRFKYGFLWSSLLLTFSLGIYQAYFSVCAVLMVAMLIVDILGKAVSPKETITRAVKYVAALAMSIGFYIVMVKLTTINSELTSYAGIDKMGQIPLSSVPRLILDAYRDVYHFFIENDTSAHFGFMRYVFVLMLLAALALIILIVLNKKSTLSWGSLCLLVLLIIIFPLASNLVYVMSPHEFHTLMIYSRVFCLVSMLPLIEIAMAAVGSKGWSKTIPANCLLCWLLTGVLVLTTYNYAIVSNKGYLKLHFAYEQAYAYSNRLITRIESVEGFSKETEIVLINKPQLDPNPTPQFDEIKLAGLIDAGELLRASGYSFFLERYLAFTNKIDMMDSEALPDELQAMPYYPDKGSIKMINNIIYVKLSPAANG